MFITIGVLITTGVIVWQGLTFAGVPNPVAENLSSFAAILSSGVLVFREGLEAILVLSAITATMTRKQPKNFGKGISLGAGFGLAATAATWFIVVEALSDINLPELDIQAATGLLAIIVLLIVMNWFFHKIYWTGWITHHTKKGRYILESSEDKSSKMLRGFILLGFTAIYREGFEVVLFLQQLRLRDGGHIILIGSGIGIILTAIVALLTFKLHKHLPYKKMLVLTGVLLGIVLLVMVGESVQEMQQANWLPVTPAGISIPGWLGTWFSVFPNLQCIFAQIAAATFVLGSYFLARYSKSFSH